MLPSEMQFDAGNLELLAKQVVEGFIIGLHKSPFHGFSVEFAEHRVYNPGDNLRHIDWKVFGKTDKMFVKKYEEETNLRCCIAIDTSSSMLFPKEGISKLQFSCLGAAALMQLLRRQMDAFGLRFFAEKEYWSSAIRSNERHYRDLITEMELLLKSPPVHASTDLPAVLHQMAETLPQRALVVIFSDFLDDATKEEEFYSGLQHLVFRKQEIIIFHVGEGEKEWGFEFENRPYEFVDMESGTRVKLKPNEVKQEYLTRLRAYHQRLEHYCLQLHIDLVKTDIQGDMNAILRAYLLKRNKLM